MKKEPLFEELFKSPTKDYYSVPFWAWNGRLEIEQLKEQIDYAEEMGYGGFIMHPRIGLRTKYLGDDYFNAVRFCQEHANKRGMQAWLYDEDKWPSGYGGGSVTKNREFRARYILISKTQYPEGLCHTTLKTGTRITADGEATLIARYRLIRHDGMLAGYEHLEPDFEEINPSDDIWYAYKVILGDQPWFNNQAYVDMLNPEATKCFLEQVYEKYLSAFQQKFPSNVPAIFSDEPQLFTWQWLSDGASNGEAGIAYTDRIPTLYRERFGMDLFDVLPELFWNLHDNRPATPRYNYCKLLAELFDESYAGIIEPWCKKHDILFTGHLMDEAKLSGQSRTSFDLMRCYRHFDLPGIDILDNRIEHTTAKQAQSICRQMNKQGFVCEMYGATNWDFDFKMKKFQGDWLAAMGVNYRIPHLMWLYMRGESKRDYPAPLDSHSPWYPRNKILEDYYARLATVLRRGRSIVRIAVLHPIESYWLACGSERQTTVERELLENSFYEITEQLIRSNYDFDYLNEHLLATLPVFCEKDCLKVGDMHYHAIILPPLLTMRETTLRLLKEFSSKGGQIFALQTECVYIDAKRNTVYDLSEIAKVINNIDQLPIYLESLRDIDFTDNKGNRISDLCFQMKENDNGRWLFIAHTGKNSIPYQAMHIQIAGNWEVEICDAMTGKIFPANFEVCDEDTFVTVSMLQNDSLLLRLVSRNKALDYQCTQSVKYSLEEDNTLLIDMMEYSLDNGPWKEKEEILRIDNQIRKQLGMILRTDAFPQPWLSCDDNFPDTKSHVVKLRSTIQSEINITQADIVWEGDNDVIIQWNGVEIDHGSDYYLDKALHRSPLPGIARGNNSLKIMVPFDSNTNLEWFYLTGQFGVKEENNQIHICELQKTISFGDYSTQGLMFYGGNVIYEFNAELPAGWLEVEVNDYKAPLIDICVDENEYVPVFMQPYKVSLGFVKAGQHIIRIRSYGSRINTFGQVHNSVKTHQYFGPSSWRTTGERWSYQYCIRPCGVYGPVIIRVFEQEV